MITIFHPIDEVIEGLRQCRGPCCPGDVCPYCGKDCSYLHKDAIALIRAAQNSPLYGVDIQIIRPEERRYFNGQKTL